MRTLLAMALVLSACSSDDVDADTSDGDPTDGWMGDDDDDDGPTLASRCEGPDPDFPVTLRFGEMNSLVVDGMEAIYHVPESPRGVLIFFHGGGGRAQDLNYLEQWRLYNRLHCNGVAVIAGSAADQNWSKDRNFATNPDAANIDALWDAVDAAEGLPRDLPVFVAGFSDGGGFAPLFADMVAAEGWDVRALALHNTFGGGTAFPTAFAITENDENISVEGVRDRYQETLDGGQDAALFVWNEIPLTAERLTVIETVDEDDADEVVAELEDFGLIDADGNRLFDLDGLGRVINTYQDRSEYRAPARITRQLRVVWATHRFSGDAAYDEADFLLQFLD